MNILQTIILTFVGVFDKVRRLNILLDRCLGLRKSYLTMVLNSIKVALAIEEKIIFEEGASHFHNYIAVGGQLKLTNQRVIFKSCGSNNYQHEIYIPLDQINKIEFFKTLFMNPNGLALTMKDGQTENFVVDDKKSWKERILNLVSPSPI